MKIKTSNLTGPALDYVVAKCEGIEFWAAENPRDGFFFDRDRTMRFSPPTNWAQGGPIIEREVGNYYQDSVGEYYAHNKAGTHLGKGPTPLIAAMRCFVASRLGDEVDIPEELNAAR